MSRDQIVLGGGCFWGVEDAFSRVSGVTSTQVGYAGGHSENPTYEEVCNGMSGHAEVVEVTFDPSIISLERLLEVFWKIHDPTQKNAQGPDIGEQYRSIILYGAHQEEEVIGSVDQLRASGINTTTELKKLQTFYPAENYHQKYLQKNPNGYCHIPQTVLNSLN